MAPGKAPSNAGQRAARAALAAAGVPLMVIVGGAVGWGEMDREVVAGVGLRAMTT